MSSIEIISIGNELLIGKVLNTNAQWIARRATSIGLRVYRITTIGDYVEEISIAIQESIRRNPCFVITTGGLGPTFDDKTLEGIAQSFGVKLTIHSEALRMVENKYLKYVEEGRIKKAELTSPRLKMAKLPEGSQPLPNPVGTAPGVAITRNNITVIALPGVPSEMTTIFEDSVMPLLKKSAGNVTFFETGLDVWGVGESEIATFIDQTMHDNPYVYIKSHPKAEEKTPHLELHLSTTAEDSNLARNRVGNALIQISELIKAIGGRTKSLKQTRIE